MGPGIFTAFTSFRGRNPGGPVGRLVLVTTTAARPRPVSAPPLLGPRWSSDKFHQFGWVVLPLRLFLGVTFVVAALQKLADPNFFDPSSPTSIQSQTKGFVHTSPIGPLLSVVAPHAGAVGVLIAISELSVGLAVLIGLWTRLAAIGGLALALTFFLTVSWHTKPYYYGSDIVFLFAWTPFVLGGAGGVLSLDAWIRDRARRPVPADPLRRVAGASPTQPTRAEVDRRTVLLGARAAAALAAVAGVTAGLTTVTGHALHTSSAGADESVAGGGSAPGSTRGNRRRTQRHTSPSGPRIASASAVPVGHGLRFSDPRSGQPAWLLHPSTSEFRAFTAVCTHAGCTVGLASPSEFICPCHGASYSTTNGQVLGGPAPSGLTEIPVTVSGGTVYLA